MSRKPSEENAVATVIAEAPAEAVATEVANDVPYTAGPEPGSVVKFDNGLVLSTN